MNVALIAGGIAIVAAGAIQWRRASALVRRSVKTSGRVVSVRRSPSDDGTDSWFPQIAFTTRDGVAREITGASKTREPRVGSKIQVAYDPDNPDNAWEFRTAGPFAGAILLFILGAGAALVGLFYE